MCGLGEDSRSSHNLPACSNSRGVDGRGGTAPSSGDTYRQGTGETMAPIHCVLDSTDMAVLGRMVATSL